MPSRDRLGWRGPGRVLREHAPLAIVTSLYLSAALAIQGVGGIDLAPDRGTLWQAALSGTMVGLLIVAAGGALLGTVFVVTRALNRVWEGRRRRAPFTGTARQYRAHLHPERVTGVVLLFALYGVLLYVFLGFKGALPAIQPFAWDRRLMELDRLLHFGHHPWVLIDPLVGRPEVTAALDVLYYIWFPVKTGFLIWIAWSTRPLRHQFLLAFFLTWIVLGSLAILFSSAGPCYFGQVVGGSDPYAPLLDYLRHVDASRPLTALRVQAILWSGYTGASPLIEGIAAMPSIHVALPALFALATWRVNRLASAGLWMYCIFVLVGSVHLGWHYAVDGYASLLLVPPIWWTAGALARAWNVRGGGAGAPLAAPAQAP